jgi:AhpD family alkylhydroperoxidase
VVKVTETRSEPNQPVIPDKRMKLRYAGTCRVCGTALPARQEAIFERAAQATRCANCALAHLDVANPDGVDLLAGNPLDNTCVQVESRNDQDGC